LQTLIAVIGASTATELVKNAAFETGKEIMRAGYSLICGGLSGVMEAACRGAFTEAGEGSGRIIGILPGSVKTEANRYVDIVISTGVGYARNSIIACSADAVIAVSGGSGTLSEIAMAWQYEKPIVAISGLPGFPSKLIGKPIDNRRDDIIRGAENGRKAVQLIKNILGR